ncbi:MAG: PAS-domain containing protein, partial [Burkholderiaceae bacterium]
MQSRWFSAMIVALAVAFIAALATAMLPSNTTMAPGAVSLLVVAFGSALLIAVALYWTGSRIRISEMQARALAWERSLESMNVGIALYDREDRLVNCNAAFRALYAEGDHLLVPGANLYD